jgi:hypothetical protein
VGILVSIVRGIASLGVIVIRFEKNSHPSPKTVNIGSTGGMAPMWKEGQMAGAGPVTYNDDSTLMDDAEIDELRGELPAPR